MKLSKIIEKNIFNATILILDDYVSAKLYFRDGHFRTKKYKSLEIDVPTEELSIWTVKHLGITRYRSYKDSKVDYINIYNGNRELH